MGDSPENKDVESQGQGDIDDGKPPPPPAEETNSGPCKMCHLSLRKSCIIIAIIGISIGAVYLFVGISTLELSNDIAHPNLKNITTLPRNATEDEIEDALADFTKNLTLEMGNPYSTINALKYSGILNILIGLFEIGIFIILLFGALWKFRLLCVIWLWCLLALCLWKIVGCFVIAVVCGNAYVPFLPMVLTLAAEIYFLWVILAFVEMLETDLSSKENIKRQNLLPVGRSSESTPDGGGKGSGGGSASSIASGSGGSGGAGSSSSLGGHGGQSSLGQGTPIDHSRDAGADGHDAHPPQKKRSSGSIMNQMKMQAGSTKKK